IVTESNSLVGSNLGDSIGSGGVTVLANGNYVVCSPNWTEDALDVGAATLGDGLSGISGQITDHNRLLGSKRGDLVGSGGSVALTNGNYVVISPQWANGLATHSGAVTFGNGTSGTVGPVTLLNSLAGNVYIDHVGGGGVTPLANGNYVVNSPDW